MLRKHDELTPGLQKGLDILITGFSFVVTYFIR